MTHAQKLLLRQQRGWTLDGRTVGHASGWCSAAQRLRLLHSSSKVKVAQSMTVGGGIQAETSLVILRERNFAMVTVTQ